MINWPGNMFQTTLVCFPAVTGINYVMGFLQNIGSENLKKKIGFPGLKIRRKKPCCKYKKFEKINVFASKDFQS